tara:strand:+ start:26683 stop:27012 length:330 start_codon:yes stop_codon:yes gene_type:complete
MTRFTKENLIQDTPGYVFHMPKKGTYHGSTFIARFKHVKGNAGPFMTFLRKNFTVEEWTALIDSGMTPLKAAETKGFILQHIKRWLKKDGFPQTQEGLKAWEASRLPRI